MTLIVLCCAIFGIGLFGVLTGKDTVAVLASVEVMLGGPLLFLVGLASAARVAVPAVAAAQAVRLEGVALLVLVVVAAEAAVGFALLVAVAAQTRSTTLDELTEVRG